MTAIPITGMVMIPIIVVLFGATGKGNAHNGQEQKGAQHV